MAVTYSYTISTGTIPDADEMMANFNDLKTVLDQTFQVGEAITLTNKTLTSPVLNGDLSSGSGFLDENDMASDSATKVASQQSIKAYIDQFFTYYFEDYQTGQDSSMEQNDVIEITHASSSITNRRASAFKEVVGTAENNSDLDFDLVDEDEFTQGDVKGTAVKFQVDTADTSGHLEDAGETPVTIGSGNTEDRIQEGCRFKLSGDATIYEIYSITDDGEGDNEIVFKKQDGSAPTKATGTYDVDWVVGTEFEGGEVRINSGGVGAATAWSDSLTSYNSGNANVSHRQIIPNAAISVDGNQVRVTFVGHSTNHTIVDNASIVERSGSTADGTETPTELLFDGESGFDIAPGGEVVSDWLSFSWDKTKDYLVIFDNAATDDGRREALSGGGGLYYKASTDSYDQQTVTGFSLAAGYTRLVSQIEARTVQYPVNERYVVITSDTNQIDTTYYNDINSVTGTETLNGQTVYYAISFDDRVTFKIWDGTADHQGFRPIAKLDTGVWYYNSNTNAGYDYETWTAADVNSAQGALEQAMAVAANQMSGTEMNAVTDAQWSHANGGFDTDVDTMDFAIGLMTTSATTTPSVSLIVINYTAETYWEPIDADDADYDIKAYAGTSTTLTKTGTGVSNIRFNVSIPATF